MAQYGARSIELYSRVWWLALMTSFDPPADSSKAAMGNLLLIDAEMALAFVRRATKTSDPMLKARRLKAAAKAYDRIITFLPQASLTTEQMIVLQQKLSVLQSFLWNDKKPSC
jgi:hypothetical protein